MIDVDAVRADTPGCASIAHFDNAGASLMPRPVLDVVRGYLEDEAHQGGYATEEARADELAAVYGSVARLLRAVPDEVALFESATLAWNVAFRALRLRRGDRILTTSTEYASNYLAFLQVSGEAGVSVEVVPDTVSGEIDVAALDRMIDEDVRLVAINHVPTNGGLVNPAAAVGEVARRHGVVYLLDACQSVGQMPLDVSEIGCDLLTATSRKFLRGPRGVGFLYVRRNLIARLEPALVDLRGATWVARDRYELRADARRFELWEANHAGRLGFGVAVDYALALGLPAIWKRNQALGARLRDELAAIPGVAVHDRGATLGAIVTFTVSGVDPSLVRRELQSSSVNVSTSSAASARIDMEARGLDEVVRASVHYFNDDTDLDRLISGVAAISRRRTARR